MRSVGSGRALPCHRLTYPSRTLGNRQHCPRRCSYCTRMIATERLLILVGNDRINTVSQRSLRPDPTSLLPLHQIRIQATGIDHNTTFDAAASAFGLLECSPTVGLRE